MAYTEKHLDKAGAKALMQAWGGTNAGMVKGTGKKGTPGGSKKPAGGKKSSK